MEGSHGGNLDDNRFLEYNNTNVAKPQAYDV